MISKAAVFAAWVSTAYAFAPTSQNSNGIFGLKSDANTEKSFFSLQSTTQNGASLYSNPGSGLFQSTTTTSTTTVAAVPKLAQRWRKSTKQLATLGPASSDKEMIEKLFLAGADIFRLNFSHGSQEQKKELLTIIRVSYLEPNTDCVNSTSDLFLTQILNTSTGNRRKILSSHCYLGRFAGSKATRWRVFRS